MRRSGKTWLAAAAIFGQPKQLGGPLNLTVIPRLPQRRVTEWEFLLLPRIRTGVLESSIVLPPSTSTGPHRFHRTGPDDAAAGIEHMAEEDRANPRDIVWI